MATIRRVVARVRRRIVFAGCLLGLALTAQNAPLFAADADADANETRSQVPDPSTWATDLPTADGVDGAAAEPVAPHATNAVDPHATNAEDPHATNAEDPSASAADRSAQAAPQTTSADSADTRPPVAKMIWKTVTSPSGRTFQVLEAASPEEIENAVRAALAATADSSNGAAGAGNGAAGVGNGGTPGVPTSQDDVAMMGDLGTRPMGRGTGGGLTPYEQWNQSRVPYITSFGVYGGYSSTAGVQLAIPTDATFAFRMGLTGFPGVGWLWTPGVELRFGQTPGAYNTNGVYGFSNLYVGETVSDDPVTKHWGVETGAGYRWILPDRRSVRWIAAIELGGRWSPDSSAPKTPTVRAFWMIAAP